MKAGQTPACRWLSSPHVPLPEPWGSSVSKDAMALVESPSSPFTFPLGNLGSLAYKTSD